ncbi:MAG TPA: SDR family oxidoreductase [Ilumatobacteraceae bacterium]
MTDRLADKTAFVTGGGAGIGRAIVLAFAAEGATVGVGDIDGDAAQVVANEVTALGSGAAIPFQCDVADRSAVTQAINAFAAHTRRLDVLVNNAVMFHYAPLVEMPEDIVRRMLDVGVGGTIWSLQAATPHLIAAGGGSVINMSSVAVSFSIKNAAVYTSIKGAIDSLTRQQAVELAPHRIRVNALAPGPISTPGANSVIDKQGWTARAARTPLGRLATAEQVGAAAVYLASEDASTITGVTLKIDGGITVAGP